MFGHPRIVRNPREKSSSEHRLLENPRVKGNTFCSDRRLKSNGLPPLLNSSESSSASYTCTLEVVQPSLRNKLADDTWILQDWPPSWKEGTQVGSQGIMGGVLIKKQNYQSLSPVKFSSFFPVRIWFFICLSILTDLLFPNLGLNDFYNPLFKHF